MFLGIAARTVVVIALGETITSGFVFSSHFPLTLGDRGAKDSLLLSAQTLLRVFKVVVVFWFFVSVV